MKKKFDWSAYLLSLSETECNEDYILDQLEQLGNVGEDVDHYPTLPTTIEALADLLELDITEADDSVILVLEEIVATHNCIIQNTQYWYSLQNEYPDNFK